MLDLDVPLLVARWLMRQPQRILLRVVVALVFTTGVAVGVYALAWTHHTSSGWSAAALVGASVVVLAAVGAAKSEADALDQERLDDDEQRLRNTVARAREETEDTLKSIRDRVRMGEEVRPNGEPGPRLLALEADLAALRAENSTLRRQLSAEASIELARAFDISGRRYQRRARNWLLGLLASVLFLAATSIYWVFHRKIEANATTPQIVQALASGAVMFAVPAYLIRVTAAQFRSQQRLAVMAEAKAVILRTFTDIVAANTNAEQVAALTERVAQSIFTVHDPGTGESPMDQVNALSTLAAKLVDKLG